VHTRPVFPVAFASFTAASSESIQLIMCVRSPRNSFDILYLSLPELDRRPSVIRSFVYKPFKVCSLGCHFKVHTYLDITLLSARYSMATDCDEYEVFVRITAELPSAARKNSDRISFVLPILSLQEDNGLPASNQYDVRRMALLERLVDYMIKVERKQVCIWSYD
jgi:hypothetical protein